jgi:RecA/RadA recombinase
VKPVLGDKMPTTFIGETTQIHRVITGWHTFDQAFKNNREEIGFPVKAQCEIYGPQSTGKSTFVDCLAGKICQKIGSNIVFADFETFDPMYMKGLLDNMGYDGNIYIALGDTDEKIIDNFTGKLWEEGYSVGIIDSIGAISPVAEVQGSIGDANMGARARLAARVSRRSIHIARMTKKPMIVLMTNHMLPILGMGKGTTTPGGKVKGFMAGAQIKLSRKENYEDGSYWLCGKVEKHRFGYDKHLFYLFVLAGFGIHAGLTAVRDCIILGLAKEERTIKLGDKSFGYFKGMIENNLDNNLFQPFVEALKTKPNNIVSETTNE